jgi:hypothetical protein
MNALLICIAMASTGWQTGYERLPEGGMEYVIQLDSMAIDSLQRGQPLSSYVPADIGQIRSFRVVMGTGKPRRDAPWPIPPLTKPTKAVEKSETPKPVDKPTPSQPEAPAKPWFPLTLALLALFASIGANVFLGWIVCGLRKRCQNAT